MYSKKDLLRLSSETNGVSSATDYRTPFRVDYSRLIHSPAFRRLQGKTQLYPSKENDFFRNRLTHSIEVAQIAKSIALKINKKYSKRIKNKIEIDTDLVEFAALAHDIGHPPFGHQGEEALDKLMEDYGGFEGNAQTLRLLTRIEKKIYDPKINSWDEKRFGLNLTSRTISSILKYDNIIPFSKTQRKEYAEKSGTEIEPVKGYYLSEDSLVQRAKSYVLNGHKISNGDFKTVECHIMDTADDIAYSTYDLEDTLKAKFCSPFDIVFANNDLLKKIAEIVSRKLEQKITVKTVADILFGLFINQFPEIKGWNSTVGSIKDLFRFGSALAYQNSIKLSSDGYLRTEFTSNLVNSFVEGIEFKENKKCLALSEVKLNSETRLTVEVLKRFNFEVNIMSPRLKIAAYRGKEIISKIFNTLIDNNGYLLMPDDYRVLYESNTSEKDKYRIVCDFIAGMTDSYCIEFYARLTSEDPETIFKPF
jgi:dGTPase